MTWSKSACTSSSVSGPTQIGVRMPSPAIKSRSRSTGWACIFGPVRTPSTRRVDLSGSLNFVTQG
eukprot:12476984-Prorocentrum_lima.AAC.1